MKFILNSFKSVLHTLGDLIHLHKFAKDILHGSFQFTVVLYLFAAFLYVAAPYTSDYMRCLTYYDGALAIAPVTLAAGVVSALLCDLIMRKAKPEESEKNTTDKENKK